MATPIDESVTAFARQLSALGGRARSRVFRMSWWSDKLLDRAMANPAFKTELFRFVDVFPATIDDADVLRHLDEYLSGDRAPRVLQAGVSVAEAMPGLGARIAAGVARSNIRRMAEQFIVGVTPDDAVAALGALWAGGSAATVDLLGEKTVVEAEADRYAARVRDVLVALLDAAPSWPARPALETDDRGPIPRVNVSVKPTALAPKLTPLTGEQGVEQVKQRLRPLLHLARDRGAFVNVDMEHLDVKDLTLRVFRELLDEDELRGLEAGIVIQAYLRESPGDLSELIAWSAGREVPITVRLVKGAYWDTETVVAQAAGWPVPVFAEKDETDACYERCVRLLHDHHGEVKAAFGSHNLRSLAYAVVSARERGIPDSGYELQMLSGMAEPVQAAIRAAGLRLRIYAPVGELVPGMAYLVRRLLENTSNESFVRQSFAEGRALDELLEPPAVETLPDPPPEEAAPTRDVTDPAAPSPYDPEPTAEWRRPAPRAAMASAVEGAGARPVLDVPALIDGERVRTSATIDSVDPADPDHVVAVSASCARSEADAAVAAAVRATAGWRRRPAASRAAVLFKAARWLAARRFELAALELFECGKPWAEADADVCEAIDFCEYYGREAIRLDVVSRAGGVVQSPPGERNTLSYQGKGVTVVIAPWNFPLAIPCGMVAAALAAGNPVILKPAEQAPAIASRLIEALEAAGAPDGVLGFLPGLGEAVGAHLVAHPDVAVIAFTGSRDVGLAIVEAAAVHRPGQRTVKRVIAEMGGKNPLIVDADADLDQAVPAAVASAFGYAGQKCSALSRLIVLDEVYEAVLARLAGAVAELAVGPPREMGTQMGPVIDGDAHASIRAYAAMGAVEGRVLISREDVPARGWFVGPTVVTDLDHATSRLAREEVFGPVLSVFRAGDLGEAIALANDTDFALTAGIISRSPVNIARASAELRAGNVYVNRSTTGAVVGRQPFGGYGMSGVGSKAGGPDYLLQYLDPKVTTENTLRQGFAPLDG
ncbi:MAG: proline dehydrogenase family protein [Acidimicrobiales bacterium]